LRQVLNIVGQLPSGVKRAYLYKAFQLICKELNPKQSWRINLALVSRNFSQQLNSQYAHHHFPTDVLSFNYQEGYPIISPSKYYQGDIIICRSIASRNAKQKKVSLNYEICLLLIHGVMHLLGWDHRSKVQRARFESVQNAMISKLDFFDENHS